jgi:hypothetical protein
MIGGLILVLAIGLFLISVQISMNYQEVYYNYATQEARAEAQEKFRQKCLNLSSGEEIADCFDDAVEAAREPQRSEEDLQAQKQMADWARLMLYVTFAIGIMTFVVTVASVLLIRETLDLQRNATREATKATRAAIAANEQSRDAFLADQRPWLAVKLQGGAPLTWNVNGLNLQVFVSMRNFGRTPALRVDTHWKVLIDVGVMDFEEQQIAFADSVRNQNPILRRTIFPSRRVKQTEGTTVSYEEIEKWKQRLGPASAGIDFLRPWIIGCVNYSSPLDGKTHQTGFIYEALYDENGRPGVITIPDGPSHVEQRLRLRPWITSGRTD